MVWFAKFVQNQKQWSIILTIYDCYKVVINLWKIIRIDQNALKMDSWFISRRPKLFPRNLFHFSRQKNYHTGMVSAVWLPVWRKSLIKKLYLRLSFEEVKDNAINYICTKKLTCRCMFKWTKGFIFCGKPNQVNTVTSTYIVKLILYWTLGFPSP